MNVIEQAFTEIFQSYKLIFKPIIKRWRIKNAINAANALFIEKNKQYFVLNHPEHDCEVISKAEIDRRLLILKKKDKKWRYTTIQDVMKDCIYHTPSKIYSGNLNAFGMPVKGSKPLPEPRIVPSRVKRTKILKK